MKSDFKASLSQLLIPEVMGLIPQKLTVPKQLLYYQFSEANIRDIPSLIIPKIGHEKPKTKSLITNLLTNALKLS